MNPYDVLDVSRNADEDEVRKAFREKAKEHHTDAGGDEEEFKRIQKAKDAILEGGHRPFQGDVEFQSIFENFQEFRQQGGFQQENPFETAHQRRTRSAQTVYQTTIDLKTAMYGGSVDVDIGGRYTTVNVPRGATEEHLYDVIGSGNLLKFNIISPDGYYRENGNDIYRIKELPASKAMTGGKVKTETLEGEKLHVTIPPGTQTGNVFRIKEKGGPPTRHKSTAGDFYLQVDVTIPTITTEDEFEQFKNEITIE